MIGISERPDRPLGATSGAEPAAAPPATPQVCGEFHDKRQLDAAMSHLEGSFFQHADLSVRLLHRGRELRGDAAAEEPLRRDEVRNLRQLGTSLASLVVGMVAAGVAVVSGGSTTVAAVAAAIAALVTLAAAEAFGIGKVPKGDTVAHRAAERGGGAVLLVHAPTPEKRQLAETMLKEAGATRVWQAEGV